MEPTLLNGLRPPEGLGSVIEVHLDIMDQSEELLRRLRDIGFEDDPFLDFYPPEYRLHYTGRTRSSSHELSNRLFSIYQIIDRVLAEARALDLRLYAECELVREIRHFEAGAKTDLSALESLSLQPAEVGAIAKADVHVEFLAGTVSQEVRTRTTDKGFYWVRTPATEHFPSEEIATLQTSIFRDAQICFDRLVANPLPNCTGIHLEQKLSMLASHDGLPLPPVMEWVH
jgi:hypothetical protein